MRYTPPIITRELGSFADVASRNSFAQRAPVPITAAIDKVDVEQLVQKYGSPLFVFSERAVRDAARRARKAFKAVYPDTTFAWSYKTNYLTAVCNIFHQEGWIAEVVSDFEYRKAEQAGIAGRDIIYNGPHKSRASLEHALRQGALVQIDNWDELGLIEQIAATMRRPVDVGIRVWMDTGYAPVWSKFGFALANGEAGRAALRVAANPRLKLHTLHTHIGTYVLDPRAYAVAAENLVALRDMLRKATGSPVPCINLGGGFPSHGLLHDMQGPAELVVPPIESFAAAIANVLNQLPRAQRPQLRLETGRHLIDDAGSLIATVVAVKGADLISPGNADGLGEHGRGSYIVDAGVNLLYTAAWFSIGVRPTRAGRMPAAVAKLYGCLCMNIDVIREAVELPPLEVGDKLVLHPVGAYNLTQSMQFIALRPAVVLIGLDGSTHVIRRREELVDLDSLEGVPAHLKFGAECNAPNARLERAMKT
jgi:diaminopimelate decarboxylase